MKILVTGGAGFIGSHVVAKLLKEQCEVVIVDNLSSGNRDNINSTVKFFEMDICSGDNLIALFNSERFDAVIHLAAQTMVPVSLNDPMYDCQVNIAGTINVLEACRQTGVRRIVFASSAAVYGNVDTVPVQEEVETCPTSFYGLSKLTAEKYLNLYYKNYGLEYVVLRYANVYGERQGDGGEGGVVSIFTRKIRENQQVTVFGDGTQTRDFVYAGDVADANWLAVLTSSANEVYNISTKTETSVNDLIRALQQATNKQISIQFGPVREGDIYRSSLDNTISKEKLGWQPKMPLTEGLARTDQWIQCNK